MSFSSVTPLSRSIFRRLLGCRFISSSTADWKIVAPTTASHLRLHNNKTSKNASPLRSMHTTTPTRGKSKETNLLHQLRARIISTGPMTVAEYMKEVLTNPMSGYYMHRDVIGSSGDFITSPEISQMFGELIALWFFNEWTKAGKPRPFYIIEVGPGRGTMSDDMFRVLSRFSDAMDVLSLHLVEVSPHLSQLQELKLCGTVSVLKDVLEEQDRHLHQKKTAPSDTLAYKQNMTKHGVPVSWYHHLEDIPHHGFAGIIAHEFFDALPVHKFQRTSEGWREVLVDIDEGEEGEHHLQYVLSRGPTLASQFFIDPKETRDHVEVSPESGVAIQGIASRLDRDGGCALVVDYGHDGGKTDTFRAFQRHALHHPLCEPGTADLTADVDFAYLKKMVQGKVVTYGPVTQEKFLKNMHIQVRLENLLKSASEKDRSQILSGFDMLTNPTKMGERYKFFGLFPTDMSEDLTQDPPGGFYGPEA